MIRKELFNSYWTGNPEDEKMVTRVQEKRVKGLLKLGMDVIVSDTNLPDKSVKKWMQVCHDTGAQGFIKDFRDVDLLRCLSNNVKRDNDKVVPDEVIIDKWKRFIKGRDLSKPVVFTPKPELEVEPYVQPVGNATLEQRAVIFDIDGTLAIMGDRSPYDGAKVWMDTPNKDVRKALDLHYWQCHHVIIVSGRDEIYREVTEEWLKQNGILYDALYMRPTEPGEKREDSIIKYELFNKHIRPKNYRIYGVYDDRHRVLRMWRKLGLTTFHVNGPDAGDF